MISELEMLKIDIQHLEERISELEHIVRQLHNTVHFQKKHSGEDGFGYWQVG
jgi:proteasome assembly chaperone (PAC2) family protein